jgi:hypothetical protein
MSELEVAYHKRWLDMLAPIEGLVSRGALASH